MSRAIRFYCAVTGEEAPCLPPYGFSPALLAYRLDPRIGLLRTGGAPPLPGGLLILSAGREDVPADPGLPISQIVQECRNRGAAGVVADWEQVTPALARFTRLLAGQLSRCGLELFLPECYAPVSEQSRVMISSALSGGTLEARLKEALDTWGPGRTVLALERMREDFTLPCFSGRGRTLAPGDLDRFLRQNRPSVYYSGEFCARYFTYQEGGRIHFVLYDDESTLAKKLELALSLGIRLFLAPWQEVSGCAGAFRALLSRERR